MWSKVEEILEEKKVTIYQLSKLSGIHINTLYNYRKNYSHEGGSKPSFENMCKIADALEVSLDELRGK